MDENLRARLLDSGEIELALLVTEAEDDSDTLVSMVSVVVVSLYSNIQLNCFLSNSACQQKIANSLFRDFGFQLEYCKLYITSLDWTENVVWSVFSQ